MAAEAPALLSGVFSCSKWLVTDQGSHFKNELVKFLTEGFRVEHHFTTAYSPWANGTVERPCREVLRATRSMLSEGKLDPKDSPSTTECMPNVQNHSPVRRLGLRDSQQPRVLRTVQEAFTGQVPTRALLRLLLLA